MHSFHRWSFWACLKCNSKHISFLSYFFHTDSDILFESGLWWKTSWLCPLFPPLSILGQEPTVPLVVHTGTAESMLHVNTSLWWERILSQVLWDPETRMAMLVRASRNLPYLTLIKSIPVDGDRSSTGRKFHADMAHCWRRLDFIQLLSELQFVYVVWMF